MITNDQIVTRAKDLLGLDTTSEYDIKIRLYVNDGATQLFGTNTRVVKCVDKEIDCYKAECPNDVLCWRFLDASGEVSSSSCTCSSEVCSCPTWYAYTPATMNNICTTGQTCGIYNNYFTIDGGYLNFPSTVTATGVRIYYYGLNTDDDGFMVLDDDQEIGLANYAANRFASKANNWYKYPDGFRSSTWQMWLAQFNMINGRKVIRDVELDKNAIRAIVNSVVYRTFPKFYG